ncbi:hypothetical protein DSL72_000018 [Monilinia vaccinii-corymbosi]|uniref:Zn(2)-C6 fungal-type domain-containing protein n=1 Tax=Monilinia vaccinii-corymbosi TaxID=61207 RepID=A0A8A3P3G0_9HELO|nr:hypothetical protein DSL72_000018 [Monilinia vaccinii-corymbosi]
MSKGKRDSNASSTKVNMAPGMGIKAPVPRTRTGCLTCRARKVKCDEGKPDCGRCIRLQRDCKWSTPPAHMLATTSHGHGLSSTSSLPTTQQLVLGKARIPKDSFVIEFPNIDKTTMPYIHHFVGFCTRFLAYANDDEGNPFKEELVPYVTTSPALLHSIIAVAAGHMSRTDKQHEVKATKHYSMALRELNAALCDTSVAKQNSTLGACLLLCVYEVILPIISR